MIKIVLVLSLMELATPTSIPIHKQVVGPGGENIDIDIQVDIDTGDESDVPAPEPTRPDFGRHSTPSPAPPITTFYENKCKEEGEWFCSALSDKPNSCCDGLECVLPGLESFLPSRCVKPLPKCLAKGQFDCRPRPPAALLLPKSAKECCPGLECNSYACKADAPCLPHCVESIEPKSTTPVITQPSKCLAEGKYDCSPTNPEEKCCDGLECIFNGCKALAPWCQRYSCVKKSLEAAKCLKTGQDCTPGNPEAKCCPNNLCDLDNRKCVRVAFRQNL